MLLTLAGAFFGLAPLAMMLAPVGQVVAQYQPPATPWVQLPNNLTDNVMRVAFAISPPCANYTYCQQLTVTVIPRCERLRGDPGCWCGNHDPLHYCAICMSSPTDNQTTADQMQAASGGHSAFHIACNAYEEYINGTSVIATSSISPSTSSTPAATPTAIASTGGSDKVPTGTIVGAAVGGALGLVAIAGLIWLISLWIRERNKQHHDQVGPSSVSYMGSENKSPIAFNAPYPHASMTHYGSGHVSPLPQVGYNPNMPEPMNPQPGPGLTADMTKIDYSLYLVTGREFLPPGKDYYESIEESIQGGVTVVQVREKKADTGEFLDIARRTKQICDKYNVPLFINDRVDIALAVGATGVHLGQTDMPVAVARRLLDLGHSEVRPVIGVSVGNVEEAKRAVSDGADYVGIGAIWATQTKEIVKPLVGVRGIGDILDVVGDVGIPAVAIGGIKLYNALHTLHGGVGPLTGTALSGLAVVTEIISAPDASIPAKALTRIINSRNQHSHWPALCLPPNTPASAALLAEGSDTLLTVLRKHSPLIHQITNHVVVAQSANATLALGASPIMATAPEEMDDLGAVIGGLLVNFGTITSKAGMLVAGLAANRNKKPVVFDPVGVGATAFRRETANELLNTWQASVIKGNAAEIGAILGSSEVVARGVDSVGAGFTDPANIVRSLAKRERCIVVMTGKTDYISDGYTAVALSNGHQLMGDVTGSGCIVGTAIAAFAAAARLEMPESKDDEGRLVRGDMFQAAVAGVLAVTIAAEIAAERPDVKGSGTFFSALIDELYNLKPGVIANKAMIEVL